MHTPDFPDDDHIIDTPSETFLDAARRIAGEQPPLSADELFRQDLAKSNLSAIDLKARLMDMTERASANVGVNVEGYVIPYFTLEGKPLPFYRLRLFNEEPKYKQPKNTPNYVYFPINFLSTFENQKLVPGRKFIFITEGEKKAALANKLGLPTIAFGGIDSWQTRMLTLPKDTDFVKSSLSKELVTVKVPDAGYLGQSWDTSPYAKGFQEVTDFALSHQVTFIIIYDSDSTIGVKSEVQRAAARLGHELRYLGFPIDKIRQMILPSLPGVNKTALDDFLIDERYGGIKRFQEGLEKVCRLKSAFPRHPNIREYVNKKLQASRIDRKAVQNISLALITELDSRGLRMHCPESKEMYYFDFSSGRLMNAAINEQSNAELQGKEFGKMLYKEFGISPSADGKVMQWLGAQFAAEDPIEEVKPHRVIARPDPMEDILRYQISDCQFVRLDTNSFSSGELDIRDNGDEGILFESGAVIPLDVQKLSDAFTRECEELKKDKPVNRWLEVIKDIRIKEITSHTLLISYLYYLSPFLHRWRGTQLPVEMIIGEAGSGKSTLCELRLEILTGEAKLRNRPKDMQDWYASITNAGGLHVTDNVQMLDRQMSQNLSDEICRLITEPQPYIEMRKYYTNSEIIRIKVDPVFCFTAIRQPFTNADIMQRSIILELDKSKDANLTYDMSWKQNQIDKMGGREGWMGHQLAVIAKFLHEMKKYWDMKYKAQFRLINLEQAFILLADRVFKTDFDWIASHLSSSVTRSISENDWALEGLCAFVDAMIERKRADIPFMANEISEWCQAQPDFEDNQQLINSRKLGRYLQSHKLMVKQIAGLVEFHKINNRSTFKIDLKLREEARKTAFRK